MGKKKPGSLESQYCCYVGESYKNPKFPKNSQKTSSFAYIELFFRVIIKQMNTFYSAYFIILGLLELFPDISTTKWWETFLPLLIVFLLEYGVQAKGLYNSQKSNRKDDKRLYSIIRDHDESKKPSTR